MKRIIVIMGILSMLLGCLKTNKNINVINAESAYELMQTEEVIVLDVRTTDEFNSGHIENAINLDVSNIKNEMLDVLPDKDAKILIYCRSGNRSYQAALKLDKLGYTNIYDFGGLNTWPYEIVK
ncbi:MAG: rhodanese-like domain-containing protein [Erysipelotrichaceae bacterium]|jgi:rhodanese-related sulfurtransferase|nr:rhodanese-like domain-containing protein [Bacillota bacterium]